MQRTAFILASLFALAACGSDPVPATSEPETASSTPAPQPVETATPVEETLANRIPTRFHGVWDYIEGTCALESDMRMEISGAEILFYESVGQVTAVTAEEDDVVVTLAMEGEGETWEQRTRLALTGEGPEQRLETSDGEAPKRVDEYPSKRCPE